MFIVTGRHRSGTSMMMYALSQFINPIIDPLFEQEIRNRELDSNYDPNPNGYWVSKEMPNLQSENLIKCHMYNWSKIPYGDYKIVWMIRDENQRKASFSRSFGDDSNFVSVYESNEIILNSFSHIKLNFEDVIQNPIDCFTILQQNGWPIDPIICAERIDPLLWRNK